MPLPLKQSRACIKIAQVFYSLLPASSSTQWRGHITFATVAQSVGVGDLWTPGSKADAIANLLERTLTHRPHLFEKLVLAIVREGMKYREKRGEPVRLGEIEALNVAIAEAGFKFPDLWNPEVLAALEADAPRSRIDAHGIDDRGVPNQEPSPHENVDRQLGELRARYYNLWQQTNRQEAGLALEGVLNGLFHLSGLKPRMPFRVLGEQIDGSFDLDREIYLVEAKWVAERIPERDLLIFRGKVEGKSQLTRGVFITLNGFTPPAIEAITLGKQPNFFLVDGVDLSVVLLEDGIRLDEMLRSKLRSLADEGRVFMSVKGNRSGRAGRPVSESQNCFPSGGEREVQPGYSSHAHSTRGSGIDRLRRPLSDSGATSCPRTTARSSYRMHQ